MQKVLLKRIPKKTDKKEQKKTMQEWATAITAMYPQTDTIPVVSVKKFLSRSSMHKQIGFNKIPKRTYSSILRNTGQENPSHAATFDFRWARSHPPWYPPPPASFLAWVQALRVKPTLWCPIGRWTESSHPSRSSGTAVRRYVGDYETGYTRH